MPTPTLNSQGRSTCARNQQTLVDGRGSSPCEQQFHTALPRRTCQGATVSHRKHGIPANKCKSPYKARSNTEVVQLYLAVTMTQEQPASDNGYCPGLQPSGPLGKMYPIGWKHATRTRPVVLGDPNGKSHS